MLSSCECPLTDRLGLLFTADLTLAMILGVLADLPSEPDGFVFLMFPFVLIEFTLLNNAFRPGTGSFRWMSKMQKKMPCHYQ